MDLRTRLTEVVTKGGAEQSAHARRLLERLDGSGDDTLYDEAAALYDAYLHDPYLTRQDG